MLDLAANSAWNMIFLVLAFILYFSKYYLVFSTSIDYGFLVHTFFLAIFGAVKLLCVYSWCSWYSSLSVDHQNEKSGMKRMEFFKWTAPSKKSLDSMQLQVHIRTYIRIISSLSNFAWSSLAVVGFDCKYGRLKDQFFPFYGLDASAFASEFKKFGPYPKCRNDGLST